MNAQEHRDGRGGSGLSRPDDALDAVLQLLDRQLVDSEGALAGKVDDVELTQSPDGTLRVTGILVGVPAWLPRTGPRQGTWWLEWWRRLGVTRAERTTPGRIGIERVAELDQDVTLDGERDGIVHLAPGEEVSAESGPDTDTLHRLNDLLELPVVATDESTLGHVLDVRLSPRDALASGDIRAVGLVVGRTGRPGSLLGYDRSADQGPWAVARVVRWIHRHTAYLPMEQVEQVDWDGRAVRLRS